MKLSEALEALKKAGTAQNRKTYARHGVLGKMFGVSYAELTRLTTKIKRDHPLAVGLWESGWHDARVLATFIADPERMKASELESWVRDVDNDVLGGALARFAAKTAHGSRLMRKWIKSSSERVSSMGWTLLAAMTEDEDAVPDAEFEGHLGTIEKTIHSALNRTRYTMNNALISIGSVRSNLTEKALAVARRIGKVEVDHGDTSCKTPDAEPYIKKTVAHRARRASKKKSKARPTKVKRKAGTTAARKKTAKKTAAKKTAAKKKAAKKKAAKKKATKKKTAKKKTAKKETAKRKVATRKVAKKRG